jgi:hypothetical protein
MMKMKKGSGGDGGGGGGHGGGLPNLLCCLLENLLHKNFERRE